MIVVVFMVRCALDSLVEDGWMYVCLYICMYVCVLVCNR